MELEKYHKKRRFKETPEPEGRKAEKHRSLIFVVQKHEASRLHYDFRLESEGVLKSWAVPKGPSLNPKDKRLAVKVEDHPLEYADFEGTIPEGNYGAGTVMVWDKGTYSVSGSFENLDSEKKIAEGLNKGSVKIKLSGKKLKGNFALVKIKQYRGQKKDNSWLLVKERDNEASNVNILSKNLSAKSGRSMEEIKLSTDSIWRSQDKRNKNLLTNVHLRQAKKAQMPHKIRPMLATLGKRPFNGNDWIFEVKWDGFRAISEIRSGSANIYSRNLLSFNEAFPAVLNSLSKLEFSAVIDGEITAVDRIGRSRFQLLQNYRNTKVGNLVYYVFDILYFNGYSLLDLPLVERKKILKHILPHLKNIKYSDHIEKEGINFFELAKNKGLEGIIAKKASSRYVPGKRSAEWIKLKARKRMEAVIMGFTKPKGSRQKFGSLLLAAIDRGELKFIGHAGSGFSEKSLDEMHEKLSRIKTSDPLAKDSPRAKDLVFVKPKYVCEIEYAELTEEGMLRQASFLGLRPDKSLKEAVDERPKIARKKTRNFQEKRDGHSKLALTNLEKIFWPKEKYTKADLIEYYRRISNCMLPHLKDRPQTLHRHPNGIDKESFYQKNLAQKHPDWIETLRIKHGNRTVNYLLIQDQESLLYAANLGCIEINPFSSRKDSLNHPDYLMIDLDPEDISFDHVVHAAQVVHKILDNIKVPSFVKTSGATGLHVYIPMGAQYTYEQVKKFAKLIATLVHYQLPETTSLERSLKKRQKKVYVDYLQNNKGQTLASVYSVRPRQGAPVSTPLEWKEVRIGLDPKRFTIKNVFERTEKFGDIFFPVLGRGINMKMAIQKIQKALE
jgi:bifunctional non-homologous end joining protein LigD